MLLLIKKWKKFVKFGDQLKINSTHTKTYNANILRGRKHTLRRSVLMENPSNKWRNNIPMTNTKKTLEYSEFVLLFICVYMSSCTCISNTYTFTLVIEHLEIVYLMYQSSNFSLRSFPHQLYLKPDYCYICTVCINIYYFSMWATNCVIVCRPSEVKSPTEPPIMPASTIRSILTPTLEDEDSVKSKQALEWFKCIKPVGEPEFRLNGDIGSSRLSCFSVHIYTVTNYQFCIDLRHMKAYW